MKCIQKVMLVLSLALAIGHQCRIYAQSAHIDGTVKVSVKGRSVECNLQYSNLSNYSKILLFNGLNRPTVTDEKGKRYKLKRMKPRIGEKVQYCFDKSIKPPTAFNVKYKTSQKLKQRIISKYMDWKGNIAFNKNSIRATEQSAWYPVLLDSTSTVITDEFTYHIQVECKDCKTIYLNGNPPKSGINSTFKSDEPSPLLLYAGNFDFKKDSDIYYINSSLKPNQESILNYFFEKVRGCYEEKLKIKYGTALSIISANPSDKKTNWMFVTFPSIVVIGNEKQAIERLFKDQEKNILDSLQLLSLTHETGHYYYGTLLKPNSSLFWVFLEGFNEYIALKANKEIMGMKYYKILINHYKKQVSTLQVTPISQIKNSDEVGITYRYYYIPLLLSAIESEIGEENMWQWMRIILLSEKNVKTDYNFFRSTLLQTKNGEQKFKDIEEKYINSSEAKQNILNAL